jgi:hypothetical protein
LWEAYNDALAVQHDPMEFAVELPDFLLLNITRADVRRLVSQGYARHLVQVSPSRARKRRFRDVDTLSFTNISCFVLTEAGAEVAQKLPSDRMPIVSGNAATSHPPRWDPGARELWLGSTLVKRFRHAALNQERILSAFEEEGWPTHIDDPLPPREGVDSKRRLHDTVNHLNQHQKNRQIRFRANGAATGVCWSLA